MKRSLAKKYVKKNSFQLPNYSLKQMIKMVQMNKYLE